MIDRDTFAAYSKDPDQFRNDLIVDVDGTPQPFGDVMDPWQRDDFAALDPALRRCAGLSNEPTKMRAYLERGRGHSKTTDLAVTACYALAFAKRPLRGYCYAADKDQAKLLRDAMGTLCRLNPWLNEILSVERHGVVNKAAGHPGEGGTLTIETSDVGSSYGILADLIIADELVHWMGDGGLWHSLISSAAKRAGCLLVIISNAGFHDSWQWRIREAARQDEAWIFSRLDGPVASWMTADRLAEQRRMLPAIAYARLWENQWSSGGGDALLPEDISAAFKDNLSPMNGNEAGYKFVAGVDLGLTRDCSAVVVLGVKQHGQPGAGRIRLANTRLWRPTLGKKINLSEVEKHLLKMDEKFNLQEVGYDPWQAEHLAQRLESTTQRRRAHRKWRVHKEWMTELTPTAKNMRAIASTMIEAFTDRRLDLYPNEPLLRDLIRLRVEEKSYGYRLTSPRDETGHGDTASAFGFALLIAHGEAGEVQFVIGGQNSQSLAGQSAFAQDIADFQRRQELYADDQELSRSENTNDDYVAVYNQLFFQGRN